MNKFMIWVILPVKNNKKIFNVMKITMLFMLLFVTGVFATETLSQTKISLIMESSPMKEVLSKIENQTNCLFVYDEDEINTNQKVSVNARDEQVTDVMKRILQNTDIVYAIEGDNIMLMKKNDDGFIRIPSAVFQQDKGITGKVTDEKGEPIIGASVIEKGSATNGTVTDMDGNFSLNVSQGATLTVSYIGYLSQEVRIENQSVIQVILEEDTKLLDEIVVIGYGSVKKSNLTGAVSKIGNRQIENRPLARAEAALQGQLAGVVVQTVSGEPGTDMQIRVRGAASVNANSDPLYVVDGVPMTTLAGLNPSDIASIEVLKDAASSAIYGSRGSNGVVIVTTQKGSAGKVQVSFNATYGIQSIEKKLDIMTAEEWIMFNIKTIDARYLRDAKNRGVTNAGIKDPTEVRLRNLGLSTNPSEYGDSYYEYILDPRWFNYVGEDIRAAHTYESNNETLCLLDWQDEFYREAVVKETNLNVSGGNDNVKYVFSAGLYNQDGIAVGTNYNRYSFRSNIESKFNKYISAGLLLAPTYIRRDGAGLVNGKDTRAHHVLSSTPVSEYGVGYDANVEPNVKYRWAGNTPNPIAYMNNIRHDDMVRIMGNTFLRITPIDELKIELSGSANYYDLDGQAYTFSSNGPSWPQGEGANSSGGHNTERRWNTLLQALMNYDKTLGYHTISLMAGYSQEQSSVGFITNQTFNKPFPNDAINYSFNGNNVAIGTDVVTQLTPNRLVSIFGRLQYDYKEKYLFSGSLRRDGGSVFGRKNKWGLFPAVSMGWNISKEAFFEQLDLKWWNMLKLRASYGATGNNSISNTAAYPTLTAVIYGGPAGYSANSLGNSNLGWEKTHSTDIAMDMGFLNNRIQISLDWYTKNTTDLLYQVPAMGASGFTTVWDNLGELHNEGFEIELNTHNIDGKFNWSTSFNLSYNKNKVISLGVDNTPIYSGFDGSNPSNVLMVGKPVNSFYMYESIGVWHTQKELDDYAAECGVSNVTFEGKTLYPGDLRYRDVNHDGALDKTNDRVLLGSPTPKFTYGMTNRFTFKNFDLSILLTAQTGGKIFGVLGRALDRPGMTGNGNMMNVWLNSWWSETEQGDGRTPYILSSTTGGVVDSRWLWSSDYLRIKNLTLGYKLPLNLKWISNGRIYVSIENLWKWDRYYNGYSPEAANTASNSVPGGSSALGLDYGGYPISRIMTLGLNFNF
jgi:TonB-linked SusC/RagA family outer membrane protein